MAKKTITHTHNGVTHTHEIEDNEHTHNDHDKEHSHSHKHPHEHPNAKAVSNRLAKAIGHLEAVKRMVDRGDDCAEVLVQLAAVRSEVNNAGKIVLMDHLEHCIVDAIETDDMDSLKDFEEAIKKFVK